MIKLHHLDNSRSQRILWLLEELELEYVIEHHSRDLQSNLAPQSLKTVHALGRAPILEDGNLVIAESGAIIEYLLRTYDIEDKFTPLNVEEHSFWIHFAEGSLMPPMVTQMVLKKAKSKVGFPFKLVIDKFVDAVIGAYFGPNLKTSLNFIEQHLKAKHHFVGDGLSGADFQMIFPLEALVASGQAIDFPAITAYVKRIHQRDAYKSALSKGGDYAYAKAS